MAIAERELTALAPNAEEAPDTEAEWTPPPYRWTREQFYQMGDLGLFEGRRVILLEGEILARPPIGPSHQSSNSLTADALRLAFGEGFFVREQAPFDVGTATDPEPDIAVIRGKVRDYVAAHPSEAALIAEISVSTLIYDRGDKASLYARAGIDDYWIINPVEQQVEVYRQPVPDSGKRYGFGYQEVAVYKTGESIIPLAKPNVPIAVADLLP